MDSHRTDSPILSCQDVGRQFRTQHSVVTALDAVSLEVPAGTLVAIAGPSGSGKTTLLSIIGCVDRPTSGTVLLNGSDVTLLSRRRRRAIRKETISMLLPQPSDNLIHRVDGYGNLRWAARHVRGRDDERHDPTALLQAFDIVSCGSKRVRDMSGGEQQRLALACALARQPSLIAADEPTSSLDRTNARLVIAALRRAVVLGATVVVATHDHELVEASDSVLRVSHGVVVEPDAPRLARESE